MKPGSIPGTGYTADLVAKPKYGTVVRRRWMEMPERG